MLVITLEAMPRSRRPSKPGSPARKPGSPATGAGKPPTRSGSNGPAAMDSLLTEQTLRKQIKAAKDDP
eukprot:621308-Amphidinium_carterae.1